LQGFEKHFLIVLFISILSGTILYLSYYYGDYTHPSMARFFMVLSIVFALGPVALKILKPNFLSGRILLLSAAACFLFYHPIAVEGRFINALSGNRRTKHSMDFLFLLKDRNILTISERPGQFTALGYGAINFSHANENRQQVLREAARHLYSKVIVFQEIEYESKKPTKDTALHTDFKLRPLYDIQVTATEFVRISEVELSEELIEQK
jgi:hypothetical protein